MTRPEPGQDPDSQEGPALERLLAGRPRADECAITRDVYSGSKPPPPPLPMRASGERPGPGPPDAHPVQA